MGCHCLLCLEIYSFININTKLFAEISVFRLATVSFFGFPGGSVGKESACNAGDKEDSGSFPGVGKICGGVHVNPLQYSCLENPMDGGAW